VFINFIKYYDIIIDLLSPDNCVTYFQYELPKKN